MNETGMERGKKSATHLSQGGSTSLGYKSVTESNEGEKDENKLGEKRRESENREQERGEMKRKKKLSQLETSLNGENENRCLEVLSS